MSFVAFYNLLPFQRTGSLIPWRVSGTVMVSFFVVRTLKIK